MRPNKYEKVESRYARPAKIEAVDIYFNELRKNLAEGVSEIKNKLIEKQEKFKI